jgi:hypothetical protein
MSDDDKEKLRAFGRSETVKDIEAAAAKLAQSANKFKILSAQGKAEAERRRGEMEAFLDDVASTTGLSLDDPRLLPIAALALARRLKRAGLANEDRSPLEEGWPEGW